MAESKLEKLITIMQQHAKILYSRKFLWSLIIAEGQPSKFHSLNILDVRDHAHYTLITVLILLFCETQYHYYDLDPSYNKYCDLIGQVFPII